MIDEVILCRNFTDSDKKLQKSSIAVLSFRVPHVALTQVNIKLYIPLPLALELIYPITHW